MGLYGVPLGEYILLSFDGRLGSADDEIGCLVMARCKSGNVVKGFWVNCPRCDHQTLKVLESRTAEAGDAIRRRRECLDCGYRFTTYERTERQPLIVVKGDGREQVFDREKLLYGLVSACSKRKVPTERLEALVIDIETQLRNRSVRSVAAHDVGSLALQGLLRIDEVAYVRFASVYRCFDNVEEFSRELTRVERARTTGRAGDPDRNGRSRNANVKTGGSREAVVV